MSGSEMLIQGGRVIDPANDIDTICDVHIGSDGRVKAVGLELGATVGADCERVDATGLLVLPGFVDVHVHLREPGFEYKETVATGAEAAVVGGFTTVACMANTRPVNDNGATTRFIRQRGEEAGLARVLPIGAVSRGLKGERMAELADMAAEGAVAFSDDGMPVMDSHLMRRVLEYSQIFDMPVVAHEEDTFLARGGCMHEGAVSSRLGLPGMPGSAEDVMVARDLLLAEDTGGHLHVAHVSTARSVEMIRAARARGVRVTTEATPHHFTLTDQAVEGYDTNTRMMPPLRSRPDREAIIEGLRDGTIDCIATDHAPHATVEKDLEYQLSANGIVGLETSFGLTWRLVESGGLTPRRAVELLTIGPCRAFGLPYGTLSVGAPADVVIIDIDDSAPVDLSGFHSRSRNSPFGGWELPGRVLRTVRDGQTVFRRDGDREIVGRSSLT